MTTFQIIDLIKSKINDIKTSIVNKGVDVPSDATLEDLSGLIENIETGGGGEEYTIDDASYLFYECARTNLFSIFKNHFALTNCRDMFSSSANHSDNVITTEDINNLDLTNVTTCYNMFKTSTFTRVTGDLVFNIPKCTSLYYFAYGYGLGDVTSITFLNSNKVTNWQQCFYSGFNKEADAQNKKIEILRWDMSACTNCNNVFCAASHTYSGCKFLHTIDFQGGSFGGSSSISTLTLDLSKLESMTKESFINMFNSLGTNKNGKTRIFKINQTIYESMSEEELAIATGKGYTVSY